MWRLLPIQMRSLMVEDNCIGMDLVQMAVYQSKSSSSPSLSPSIYKSEVGSDTCSRPNHFIVVKMTQGSSITNLHIQNWPVHLFSITSSSNLTLSNLTLDNSAGNAPNNRSDNKAAAHNSDGIDISSSSNVLVSNIRVNNQDDCVAITSGNNVTVENIYCVGSHGLSIGSVGGKSNNNVTNILVRPPPFPSLLPSPLSYL